MDAALEHVGLRHEVGVEDQDELALGGAQAVLERAGLEAGAIDAVDVLDVQVGVARAQVGDLAPADLLRLVGRVVEHLDLEAIVRVADLGDGVEQPLDDVHLVEQRQLHGHGRQIGEGPDRARSLVAVAIVEKDQRRAMEAVEREHQQDDEIGPYDQTSNSHEAQNTPAIVIEL